MSDTSIEWTDTTWNPTRGCTKVSPGCKHCYAETFAERWRGVVDHPYEQGFDLKLVPHKLVEPLHWRKPKRVFVNSMSDLFHTDVPDDFIAAVFGVMMFASRHTFQVLTKRAERMRQWLAGLEKNPDQLFPAMEKYGVKEVTFGFGPFPCTTNPTSAAAILRGIPWPLPNVWLGVSVESQRYADERIPHLLATPAAVRFLSCEPLLEGLDLSMALEEFEPLNPDLSRKPSPVSWVITGAESGNGARAMNEDWVRSLRDQCSKARVPFFYKQRIEKRRKVSLPVLDGRKWAEFPEVVR